MTNRPDYSPTWTDYRRRRRWFWGVYLGGILALVWLFFQFTTLASRATIVVVLGPPLCAGFVVTLVRLQLFRCPRCGRPFFTRSFSNPLTKRCIHCGLPKWSKEDPDADEGGVKKT